MAEATPRAMTRSTLAEGEVRIGRGAHIAPGTRISPTNLDGVFPHLIHIGRNYVIAPTAMVLTHDASYYVKTGEYLVRPVHLGDNVFVGYGAIIMPGVTIGDHAVIGAGSVVTRDVPPDRVVAGVPARLLCSVEDYLSRRPRDHMFVPPYVGKPPKEVDAQDVERFRAKVYRRMEGVDGKPC